MPDIIRLATPADAAACRIIYAPVVEHTVISFEFEPPTEEEMQARIAGTLAAFPWLVYRKDEAVCGYAYAGPHRQRAAYKWAADVSAYVHEDYRRKGVGRALYYSLLEILQRQGYYAAYAGITLPNPASVGLHESLGFKPVGIYREVGYKLGAWHDVGWWQYDLAPRTVDPPDPISLQAIMGTTGLDQALALSRQEV